MKTISHIAFGIAVTLAITTIACEARKFSSRQLLGVDPGITPDSPSWYYVDIKYGDAVCSNSSQLMSDSNYYKVCHTQIDNCETTQESWIRKDDLSLQ